MLYSAALFVAAATVLGVLLQRDGFLAYGQGPVSAVLFVFFGLYTITMGFPHPGFGHVSFDRVGQVAAILILGPVDAAWVCGLASLIYPWKRLHDGEPLRLVTVASLHNAGLMSFVVLGGGLLYTAIGGRVPLLRLDLVTAGHLLVLMFAMQLINDVGMLAIFRFRGKPPGSLITLFTTAVEMGSALIAVLVALVVALEDPGLIALLLVVLTLGMLVLKRYAEMRSRLEALVEQRTEELRLKSKELERQATHDKLTGLYNRRYADDYLARQFEQSRRSDQDFTIALADIDHFKRINDRYSHAVGDQVLSRVAEILHSRCRQTDVVARYGGEEFLLCFPDTSATFAEQICGQIRRAVESADWSDLFERGPQPLDGFRVTMSFGIAVQRADSRPSSLLSEADIRLYRAKNNGRNRVVA
jgi:diguanylate cyclase (GGDEF)-like protein